MRRYFIYLTVIIFFLRILSLSIATWNAKQKSWEVENFASVTHFEGIETYYRGLLTAQSKN